MNKISIVGILITGIAVSTMVSCGDKKKPGLEFARNMYDPIAYNYDQVNKNFENGQTAQVPPAGTTPVGFDPLSQEYPNTPEGVQAASDNLKNPLAETPFNLEKGQLLYLNMCSHCHGEKGNGDGAIIEQGKFPPPPSYSKGISSRGGDMKDLTDGRIFHTITHGLNLMGPHKSQLNPTERWMIVMYVKKLQKLQ